MRMNTNAAGKPKNTVSQDFLILIVEDDPSIRNLITATLKIHNYAWAKAATAREAIMLSISLKPQLVLLDLGLPDMDGIEVIRNIRSWSNLPIIVISARGSDSDKISALDEGADDYLTKPFSTDELLARIRVTQRRLSSMQDHRTDSNIFINGELTIIFDAAEVLAGSQKIHLTATEYKLLKLLSLNVGKVLTYAMIIKEIWGGNVEMDIVSLRVHMASLRKKLGDSSRQEPFIRTHVGIGYSMTRF